MEQISGGGHPCPVCGRKMFQEYDSYEICEFCGWEDNAFRRRIPIRAAGRMLRCIPAAEVIAKRSRSIPLILGRKSRTNFA